MADVEQGEVTSKAIKPRFKRLVFCFDGTWNKLAADTPTNVVLTAASIERLTAGGITQVVHYDEGVGTGVREKYTGGIFGAGLDVNLREAYRFLLFNYDPGDEIFVFGFSRGAFTARTFVGLLRHVGPLRRLHVDRIDEAIELYRNRLSAGASGATKLRQFRAAYADGVCVSGDDDVWRCDNIAGYQQGSAPLITVKYLGVWDTVAAMGVPDVLPGSRWFNRKHHYHDMLIDSFVENVRHAVAIDERRATFPATLADGLDTLNKARGYAADDPAAPYQERWFPGVHGSVGGGGDIRGLSDAALIWVLEGAKHAGLKLDTARGTRIHGCKPDPIAPLLNIKNGKAGIMDMLKSDRLGPSHAWQVHPSAQRRWHSVVVPNAKPYRPAALRNAASELNALAIDAFVPPAAILQIEIVQQNDTLGRISKRVYGKASHYLAIFGANRDVLDDPDIIFPGQQLRIPVLQVSPANEPAITTTGAV